MALKARDKFIASQAIAQAYPSEVDANGYFVSHPETEADQLADAGSFAKTFIKQAATAAAARNLIGDGIPLGMVAPFLQTSIPDGWLSCENGQEVLRSAYPELWAWVQTDAPLITEAQWQTKAAAQKSVGFYSDGDGSTTFRLPRLIGFMEGTTAANVGQFTEAGLPNIEGEVTAVYTWEGVASGALSYTKDNAAVSHGTQYLTDRGPLSIDASDSNSIYGNANTVQPESVGMVWCVRAFGAAVNQGTVDITALAQSLNLKASLALDNLSQDGEDHFLGDDNFCIIYPNNGTAANPANVTNNSRYVIDNPFAGYVVNCIVEIKFNNQWGATGWYTDAYNGNARSIGVAAHQLDDNTIVIQTGSFSLVSGGSYSTGAPWPASANTSSAPCRVKVWKIGKI